MDDVIYYITEENIFLKTKELKTEFLKKIIKVNNSKAKLITIDIETIVTNGIHKPYLFSMFLVKGWFLIY